MLLELLASVSNFYYINLAFFLSNAIVKLFTVKILQEFLKAVCIDNWRFYYYFYSNTLFRIFNRQKNSKVKVRRNKVFFILLTTLGVCKKSFNLVCVSS